MSTPVSYSAMVPSGTGVVSLTRTKNIYRARTLWWTRVKKSIGKLMVMVIDKEESFNLGLYAFVPTGIHRLQNISLEVVLVRPSVPVKAQFFLSVIIPILLPFKLNLERG